MVRKWNAKILHFTHISYCSRIYISKKLLQNPIGPAHGDLTGKFQRSLICREWNVKAYLPLFPMGSLNFMDLVILLPLLRLTIQCLPNTDKISEHVNTI